MTTTTISRGTATSTSGGCVDCGSSLVSLERTRFFPRQLVTADDLTQEQTYFREKARRHNRLLHGWGIVCGVEVCKGTDDCTAVVKPGYVLGPYGDEILVNDPVSIDLCATGPSGGLDCSDVDPWCSDVRIVTAGSPQYLAIRCRDCETRPVRVPGCGCGCDESACEYSRVRDGYELALLPELPTTYVGATPVDFTTVYSCAQSPRTCPPCPPDPWVILAAVTIEDGVITNVDGAHRRYVVSFADYWFTCPPAGPPPPPPPPPPTKTICHQVYGFEWEGISAMPPDLARYLDAGDLVSALQHGLADIGTVEFMSGEGQNPASHLVSPLPFKTDSLYQIWVYPVGGATTEPAVAQATEIGGLVVTNIGTVRPTQKPPKTVPPGVTCPLVTVVILGVWEI